MQRAFEAKEIFMQYKNWEYILCGSRPGMSSTTLLIVHTMYYINPSFDPSLSFSRRIDRKLSTILFIRQTLMYFDVEFMNNNNLQSSRLKA